MTFFLLVLLAPVLRGRKIQLPLKIRLNMLSALMFSVRLSRCVRSKAKQMMIQGFVKS